ncbi:hypothetical protein [Amycolatopsis taiwanensis]|uniref:hypothetical protein n=1 Tax=Amycolatopsis taiwanensis TaxID=342230 RepID=UPI0004B3E5C6|nr:hypothetical protein [Amycolatopsis taiwanensis]
MTYPPAPEQYPNSGGFSQPPGQYPGMPPSPGGVDPQPKPSGGTALTAAAFAIAGTVFGIIFAIGNFDSAGYDELGGIALMQGIAYLIEVVTLGLGATLLFMRKALGRWLALTGSVVHVVQWIIAVLSVASALSIPGLGLGGPIAVLVMSAPAIATAVLLMVPLTGRWLAWGNQPQPGQQPAYGTPPMPGQQPGYGQQPQNWS